jgi:hypothetical protein
MGVVNTSRTEVVIAGGGLAGMVTAYELLDQGRRVLLIDKDTRDNFGGLARESFGGVHMIGTPHQRRLRIQDSPELAWQDWQSVANYDANDRWPREWARFYCENSIEYIPHLWRWYAARQGRGDRPGGAWRGGAFREFTPRRSTTN